MKERMKDVLAWTLAMLIGAVIFLLTAYALLYIFHIKFARI